MGSLQDIQTGLIGKSLFTIIHGAPGVGKTTLASQFPKPLFIGNENPVHVNASRLIDSSFDQFKTTVANIKREKPDFRTIIVDSISGIQRLAIQKVLAYSKNEHATLVNWGGSWGQGTELLVKEMDVLLDDFRTLLNMNYNVVLACHSVVSSLDDPESGGRRNIMTLDLKEPVAANYQRDVDLIFYLKEDIHTHEAKKRGASTGKRFLCTSGYSTYVAKTRFPLKERYEVTENTIPFILNEIRGHFNTKKEVSNGQ